ncbi:MAG: glycosyltransferase family 39 protein, partial [Candidatus Eisenbacteria bacterium]|nr:glycosyltransferase family 39 protein [Candidatus Eisenbacteria bacterium]
MTAEAVPETPRSVLTLAAATVVLHLASNLGLFGWEYFRDELYYLVCARHPALGYVDHPPLSIWILSVVALFDHGIFAIRLVPALAAGATVWLTGRMASDLGARRGATTLAALAAACAPILRAICGFYSMNALEVLTWTLLAFLLVRNLRDPSPRRWILIGATLGLGILNKHTTGMFGVVLVIGLFLSPSRNVLRSPGVWLGAALAAALTIPNLAWQAAHGFPSLEFYRNADLYKNVPTPPHAVVIEQIVTLHPLTFPLWAAGLAWCLFAPAARRFRSLGWTFLLLLVLLVASGSSRPDRIAGAYPMM